MTSQLHPDQATAARVLTDTQLVRWVLHHIRGFSVGRIARLQGVSRQTIRESLESSSRAIQRAKEDET